MKYHAKLEHGGKAHFWWNYSKEKMKTDLLIPFINGQVIVVTRSGRKSILNMKNVTFLSVYKTKLKLKRTNSTKLPNELKSKDFEKNNCTDEIIKEVRITQVASPVRSFLQQAFTPPKNQVFVIMQFNDKTLESAYDGVIKPLIKKQGLKPIRIDEIQDSGKITDQILENIATSKYVLADLSGARPNCYYETGFAHAFGKQLILTIKKTDSIHFDLQGHRFIEWETEAELRKKLQKRFTNLKQME